MGTTVYTANPFPGIRNFEAEEDYLFFGRDQQIKDILQLLSSTRFMALIGYSGSGKSSLIKAGIIPAVTKKNMMQSVGQGWGTIYFRPGSDPFNSFAAALLAGTDQEEIAEDDWRIHEAARFLRNDATSLAQVYQKYTGTRQQNWLIVIDQFEEIFRFRSNTEGGENHLDSQKFVDLLLSALADAGLPVYIMVSMRSDFLDDCTEFAGLPEAINKGSYLLPRISNEGIRDIIVKPVEVCSAAIAPGLVNRLLDETKDEADQLPVLQHAMMRTWEYWRQHESSGAAIDENDYEAVGTMSAALSIHAEEIYNGLDHRKQKIAEKIFRALTDVISNAKGTRRPAQLKELVEVSGASEEDVVDVIDEFRAPGRAFLMPVYTVPLESDTVVDIAHESLMRVWVRLKDWVYAEEKSAELYMRLSRAARLYQEGKTGLWIDPDLALAIKWQQDNSPTLAWAVRYDPAFERAMSFLEYSKKENLFKIEQKAKKQEAELRSARRTAIVLGTASVLAILLLVFALNLKFKAEASEKRALENEKELKAEGVEADMQKKEAVLQQKIAEQQQSIASQQQSLAEVQKLTAIQERKNAEDQKQQAVLQRQEAVAQRQQAVYQKTQADSARVAALDSGKAAQKQRDIAINARRDVETLRMLSEARSIAFKSNQLTGDAQKDTLSMQMAFLSYVINREYGGSDQNRAIYDALKAQLNHYYSKVLRYTYGVKYNPSGYDIRSAAFVNNTNFFTTGDDGVIKEWSITGNPVQIRVKRTSKAIQESITSLDLSDDKKYLLTRTLAGQVNVWDADNINLPPLTLTDIGGKIQYAAFLPAKSDYHLLVKTDKKASVYSFTKTGFKLINQYALCKQGSDNEQAGCVQVKKGIAYVYVAQGNSVCQLAIDNEGELKAMTSIATMRDRISSLITSNNGNTLAIGTEPGTIDIYSIRDTKPSFEYRVSGHSSRITGMSFNRDESVLASGSLDNTVRLVKYQKQSDNNRTEDLIFQDGKKWIRDIAISPNYKYVLTVGQSGLIQIWPLTESMVLQEITNVTANKKMIAANVKDNEIQAEIGADVYKRLWSGRYKSFKDFWNTMTNKYIQ